MKNTLFRHQAGCVVKGPRILGSRLIHCTGERKKGPTIDAPRWAPDVGFSPPSSAAEMDKEGILPSVFSADGRLGH